VASWSQTARRIRVPLGFAFAALFLWLADPRKRSLLIGVVFVAIGLIVRALASGHVQKNEHLATSGPYAYTRNPLYLGSSILAIGFAIAARSLWVAVALVLMLVTIYLPVIRDEEEFLRQRFPEFADYARQVPRWLPRLKAAEAQTGSFSWTLYWKHREYNATLGAAAILAALIAKMLWFSRS